MQQRIIRAVELARTSANLRSADWLSRVLGFEPDAVAVPNDELTLVTTGSYLDRSKYAHIKFSHFGY
jgi:hypothetical protein